MNTLGKIDDDLLTEAIIGAAIEVHRVLGPGFLESAYEEALSEELRLRGIPFARQVTVPMSYKSHPIGDLRLDVLVDKRVILEIKAVDALHPIHQAQLLSYLKATNLRLGLLMNFCATSLVKGIKRIANSPQPALR